MKKKVKILLTGQKGQLAQTIIKELGNKYDIKSYSKQKIDITKKKDLLKLNLKNSLILINAAAYNDVEKSEKNKKIAYSTNYLAVKNLEKICKKNKIFFIHFSTDYVFDGKKKISYKENSLTNPINQYGKSKEKGEKYLLNSNNKNFLILRTSWVYSHIGMNFYSQILKLIKKKENIKVVNDQFGIPTSAKFITDNLDKIIKKLIKKEKMSKIYHLTPNGKANWYQFSLIIYKLLVKKMNKKIVTKKILPIKSFFHNKAKRPLYSVLNSSKIQRQFKMRFKNWKYYIGEELK